MDNHKMMDKIRCNDIGVDIIICPEGMGKNKVYSINAIQVPNVVTQGRTIDEAKKRLKEALMLYFEDSPKLKQQLSKLGEVKE